MSIDTKSINPQMLILARQTRGLKQHELADLLDVSQGLISKAEKGLSKLNEGIVRKLSVLLNYPVSFFYDQSALYPFGFYLYRKYSSMPKGQLEAIVANLKINLMHIHKFFTMLEFDKEQILHLNVEENTPEECAYLIREKYKLPPGPVKSVTSFIERFGIIVFPVNTRNRMFAGLTVPLEDENYVVFVNKNMPHDRLRFTLAHELGHIILHNNKKVFSDRYDDEANLFASAFLMPEYDIEEDLKDLDIDKLALLKLYWNVSMASLLVRSRQLGFITESKYVSLYKYMSKLGYRSEEPVDCVVPEENPEFLEDIIATFQNDLSYDITNFCNLLCCTENYFRNTYLNLSFNMKILAENRNYFSHSNSKVNSSAVKNVLEN